MNSGLITFKAKMWAYSKFVPMVKAANPGNSHSSLLYIPKEKKSILHYVITEKWSVRGPKSYNMLLSMSTGDENMSTF